MANKILENILIQGATAEDDALYEIADSKSRYNIDHASHFAVHSIEEMKSLVLPESYVNGEITCDVIGKNADGDVKHYLFRLVDGEWKICPNVEMAFDKWLKSQHIVFGDKVIEEKMLALCDDDGDGLVSIEESKKTLSAGTNFQGITEPFYANDLQKFPNLTPSPTMFSGSTGLQFPLIWREKTPPLTTLASALTNTFIEKYVNEDAYIDLTGWDVSQVKDANHALCFRYSRHNGNLDVYGTIDITGWNTSGVTNFSYFAHGANIYEIKGIEDIDTSSATTMRRAIMYLIYRKNNLDLSKWVVNKVTDWRTFLQGTIIKNVSLKGWKFSPNASFREFLRLLQISDSLDITGWETSHIKNWYEFMAYCSVFPKVVDMTSLDFSSATNLTYTFLDLNNARGHNVNAVGGKTIDEVRAEGIKFYKNVNISFNPYFKSFDAATQLAILNGLADVNGKTDASGNPVTVTLTVSRAHIKLDMGDYNGVCDENGIYPNDGLENTDFKIAMDKGWTISLTNGTF